MVVVTPDLHIMSATSGDGSRWDRRGGLERRRQDRRRLMEPVLFERREELRRDPTYRRRLHRAIDVERRSDRTKRASSILGTPLLGDSPPKYRSRNRISLREGLVASVYSAWEKAAPQPDGALYKRIDGQDYRRVGSRLQDVDTFDSVEEAEAVYAAEYQRAYRLIYSEHPELRGSADEVDGEIVLR